MPKAVFSVAHQDPSIFPMTLWGNILANSFIDLTTKSSIFTTQLQEKGKHLPTSLVTSSSSQTPPKLNVTDLAGIGLSHGPSTRQAVLLVFPHCKELSIYGAHIEDTFLTTKVHLIKCSKYDRQVCICVAESPRIWLSDMSAFFPDYAYSNLNTGTIGRLGALWGPRPGWVWSARAFA
jgi:hypothetical protein